MTTPVLEFWGKPACLTNKRQRRMLTSAGVEPVLHDLISTPWAPSTLRPFFGDKPIAQWFNKAAPAIRDGELDISALTEQEALELMCCEPILIRRPLIRIVQNRIESWSDCGFDRNQIEARLGVTLHAEDDAADEGCRHDIKDHDSGQGEQQEKSRSIVKNCSDTTEKSEEVG